MRQREVEIARNATATLKEMQSERESQLEKDYALREKENKLNEIRRLQALKEEHILNIGRGHRDAHALMERKQQEAILKEETEREWGKHILDRGKIATKWVCTYIYIYIYIY